MTVNSDRLYASICEFGKIGAVEGGGVTRIALLPEERQAHALLRGYLETLGVAVSQDAAGNLIGVLRGTDSGLKPIAMGSHLDTVPKGGPYDGALGVLAGFEVVRTLIESGTPLKRDLWLVAFTGEEYTMVGSLAFTGAMPVEALLQRKDCHGMTVRDGMLRSELDPSRLEEARQRLDQLGAYIELHIEQGPHLEATEHQIGVVTAIAGRRNYVFSITGQAGHAGTVPLELRSDAFYALCQLGVALRRIFEMVDSEGGRVTAHAIEIPKQASNVITAGPVVCGADIRYISAEQREKVEREIASAVESIRAGNVVVDVKASPASDAATMSSLLVSTIEDSARSLDLRCMRMSSGAGHDAMHFPKFGVPTGMIFVPSRGGISHSPKEYTSQEQCAAGANVLLRSIAVLDQRL